ncbi:hypothetical protein DERF_009015 [Dermatophagoides farinae]|uniref:Uncharacterized protein n=1 Tax=Dermatophagoides farinae TaxID=6954 RepID=A0A922HU51_DERFA|nr:hypothetical protein DERF_009015 [Dermatophagoides farinae]
MKNINDKNVDYSIENYNNQDQRLIYVRHIRLWIRIYQQIFQMIYIISCKLIGFHIEFALFVSITMILSIKFKQIKTRWMKKNYESINFDIKVIPKIRNRTIQLLILTESVDRTYAVLMFLIILVNGPMNAYVTMIITIKSIPFTEQLLFLSMSIYQWSFIFLFHYTAIRFGQNIHYPSKYFINHYYSLTQPNNNNHHHGSSSSVVNIRDRLQLSRWLEKFHTKRCYGLTYGRTNLITMNSFVRFIAFYAKFMMIAYKLIDK